MLCAIRAVLQRQAPRRLRLDRSDRLFCVLLSCLWRGWGRTNCDRLCAGRLCSQTHETGKIPSSGLRPSTGLPKLPVFRRIGRSFSNAPELVPRLSALTCPTRWYVVHRSASDLSSQESTVGCAQVRRTKTSQCHVLGRKRDVDRNVLLVDNGLGGGTLPGRCTEDEEEPSGSDRMARWPR